MSWRILTLTKPSRICVRHKQLNWTGESGESQNVPLEDISVIILENPQVQITSALLSSLAENGAVVFTCDASHMPNGAFFSFHKNSRYTETALAQIDASQPLRKRMWQDIVIQKIRNQSAVLRLCNNSAYKKLDILAENVKSGDVQNLEGVAARIYWSSLWQNFNRNDDTNIRNHALDYGYAVLRGCVARNIVGAGLLPFYGIHHCNKLDNFCLADDLIEPWRPFVDYIVCNIDFGNAKILTTDIKQMLVSVLLHSCVFNGRRHSIMNAMPLFVESIATCFKSKNLHGIKLPTMTNPPEIVNTDN